MYKKLVHVVEVEVLEVERDKESAGMNDGRWGRFESEGLRCSVEAKLPTLGKLPPLWHARAVIKVSSAPKSSSEILTYMYS